MFRFKNKQVVANIGSARIGGQPGENPTAMAGTIFYEKHSIVRNPQAGEFDRKAAENLILGMEKSSSETHLPALLQIFFHTVKAGERYLDFCSSLTDMPLIIDSNDGEARARLACHASEIGLAERTIYNSISMAIGEKEKEILRDSSLYSAIVLAFNSVNEGIEGKLKLMESGGSALKKGLMSICDELGFKNLLLDPAVLPLGQNAAQALRSLIVFKATYGYPVGCGMHNAASSWKWLKGKKEAYKFCDVSANAILPLLGADFILFGPIENASAAFPVVAMSDVMVAETAKEFGIRPSRQHPINYFV